MKKKETIAIISSTRADYGILKNLIIKLKKEKNIKLKFIVSGTHFDKKYGRTLIHILKDKIKIDHKIPIKLGKSSKKNIIKNMAQYMIKICDYYLRIKFKAIILLGDRYEMLAIASVANILNIPLIHLYGGEITNGSYDNQIRHAITKLSDYHFVSTLKSKKRVIQMGEEKKKVFLIGSLGVENLLIHQKKNNLLKIFKHTLNKKKLLICYHSQTNNINASRKDLVNLLSALKHFKNYSIIFTYPNHDVDSEFIIQKIKTFCKNNKNSKMISSLGQENFYECLKSFDCIVGNSSAGIIEAPSAKIPTINIGLRQSGRDKAKSIFSINGKSSLIKKTIIKVMELKSKKQINYKNPYYKKNSSDLILKNLKYINFSKKLPKIFNQIK